MSIFLLSCAKGPTHYLHAIALYYQLFLVDISAHADIMSDGFRLLLYLYGLINGGNQLWHFLIQKHRSLF